MTFDPHKFFADETLPPAPSHLGWRLIDFDFEQGSIKVGFSPKPEFLNPAGHIQGGFISAMLDDTIGPSILIKTPRHRGRPRHQIRAPHRIHRRGII